ncbi:hypothetical protein [Nocardia sp. NPDC052112]|uniref:hypothetical protein n=1 Tax=Nocardia sp. NPDC052112 TaxID=3155646 RepID=UPI00343F33CC
MSAPLGRGRARIVTAVTGTAFAATAAALVAGAASAQPPLPAPGDGDLRVTCVLTGPGEPRVVIQERRRGPAPGVQTAPLPPDVAMPDCPDIDPSGPVNGAPARPGGPIRPDGPGVVQIRPAPAAPTGSSGS